MTSQESGVRCEVADEAWRCVRHRETTEGGTLGGQPIDVGPFLGWPFLGLTALVVGRPERRHPSALELLSSRIRALGFVLGVFNNGDLMVDRAPRTRAVSHGTKPLARRAKGRSSATTSLREPISQHSVTMSQSSLQSSTTAWAVWKLMRIQQSWVLTRRESGVCTQQERLLEVCTATTDWVAILFWIAWFSAAWQEQLVPGACWATE